MMDVAVKAEDEGRVEVKWSQVRSEWADGRTRGLWLLPRCWGLKAWWWLAPETGSSAPIVPVTPSGGSPRARPLFHPIPFSALPLWHNQGLLLASKRPCRNYTIGLVVYLSSSPKLFILKLQVCHTVTPDVALCTHLFVYCVFIMSIFSPLLFLDCGDPPAPAAASIQPSLTAAQFQLKPQPAESG